MRKPRKRRAKNAPERPLSESTLHHTLTVLHGIYRLALSRGLVTRSPLDGLDRAELPKRKGDTSGRTLLDEQGVARLVRGAPEHYRTVIAILAYTGCRIFGSPGASLARHRPG
jgi:integrase